MDFSDEGLASVAGMAQSSVRDVIASLPDGMTVDVSAATGLGLCSPAQLADEGPEAVEGKGCPDDSKAGTLEVESQLLGVDMLAGSVYLGTPLSELAKGSPVVLYAVARNAGLGVVVKQEIELEPDPATGQLVVYAEDLPQLPFSSLDLDLFAGDSPLITPPRCGEYEIEALLTPWAEEVDYRLLSKFSLETGPGGGPCPSDAASEPSSHADPPPAASLPARASPCRRSPDARFGAAQGQACRSPQGQARLHPALSQGQAGGASQGQGALRQGEEADAPQAPPPRALTHARASYP